MGWIDIANLTIGVIGLTLSILGLGMSIKNVYMEQRSRTFFYLFFVILIIYIVLNLTNQVAFSQSGLAWAWFTRISLFLESLFSSILTVMLTAFLLYQSGEDWRHSTVFRICSALWMIYIVFLISTQFTGFFYLIDDNNNYQRGPFYPLLLVPVILIMCINLAALWHRREKLNSNQRTAFACYCFFPMIFMLIQIFFYGLTVIVLGTAIGALAMLSYIQRGQMMIYLEKLEENHRLLTDTMMSQIKPHFLYNTLGSIEALCDRDPKKAKLATRKFSKYLRGNMNSLTAENMIPFDRELKHTKLFLELEQIRFGDDLHVDYRIQSSDFYLPPLTLEPIVENAVKHGIRKNPDGIGTVIICTAEYENRFEVQVIDDGTGFDPQTVTDNHKHIGIRNVRERLRTICGGSLIIVPAPQHGTVVTILLPKKTQEA